MGTRQLKQAAQRADPGGTSSDESSQFCPSLHQRDEDHAREVCGTPARRSSSPATGRKSEQHGNDRCRVRLWKCQFDAQCFSAGTKNCTGTVSSPLPKYARRETAIKGQSQRQEVTILNRYNDAAVVKVVASDWIDVFSIRTPAKIKYAWRSHRSNIQGTGVQEWLESSKIRF
jgi:hypothetical protein